MSNPIKPTIKTEIFSILLILLSIASSFYFYFNFPSEVPIHWNINGQPDNFGSSFFAAFFFPAMIVFMYLLFLFIPYVDPKKERYKEFAGVYHVFKLTIILFMVAIYFISSLNGLGYGLPVGLMVTSMVGILFIIIGKYMSRIKSNWFVGIRTPWTLSNEKVWDKTHRFGGKVFIFAGLLFLLNGFLPNNYRVPLFIAIIVMILLGTIGYSYIAYLGEEKRKK